MYECPGCGANLKFDIASGQMSCAYCGMKVEPHSLQKDTDAVLEDTFEATVFTCPQCGGEMLGGDQDATAFCSFCGAANILTSRLTQEKRPDYIIPFKKTREDCKRAYARKMRWALFAPRQLRDPAYIDSFRGIYMPYWTYKLEQKGEVCFKGRKIYRKGDYVYTGHYDLTGNVDAGYYGFSYDASSTFYDNISESLAPYYVQDQVEFTPAYLSGFYADIADVDEGLYHEKAVEMANESSWQQICTAKEYKKYNIDYDMNRFNLTEKLHTRCSAVHSTMYPVWFLSWRKDDRVAYATVNGQTGKVVADLPIDSKRFVGAAMILTLPLFILLNLLGTMKPLTLLILSSLLGIAAAWIYLLELRGIRRRENHETDAAMQAKQAPGASYGQPKRKSAGFSFKKWHISLIFTLLMVVLIPVISILVIFQAILETEGKSLAFLGPLAAMAVCGVVYFMCYREEKKLENYRHRYSGLVAMGAQAVVALICLVNPVSDLWYYLGALLILLSVLFDILDIIKSYNRLAMRRLPQFDKQGGDHHA